LLKGIYDHLNFSMLTFHQKPSLQKIEAPWIPMGTELFIKREDFIHPQVSGNKWRKLVYNLERASLEGSETLVTFGGAFSNHIYATAAAARETGMKSVGIIRGESSAASNETLSFAYEMGMRFIFVDRVSYRDKPAIIEKWKNTWHKAYILPEGGTNSLAIQGCREIVDSELLSMNIITVPVGTGGTMAGILAAMPVSSLVMGFSALKGDFLKEDVAQLLASNQIENQASWEIITDAHEGGYGKISEELIAFIRQFKKEQDILLDPIYTGKMMLGIKRKMESGYFPTGSRICAIHTGGIQGWGGVGQRFGIDLRK
jgi:1-aminocyclopropane-1-carboxylate deaminase/D-cysteine desulfhydrase-like pyridoxal-dependent ACC family enzyme